MMRTFTTSNDITMVKGLLFNWRVAPVYHGKEEPFGYAIDIGTWGEMHTALYLPDDKILSLFKLEYSSNETFRFSCKDIFAAEIIVRAFVEGNDYTFKGTIYDKDEYK